MKTQASCQSTPKYKESFISLYEKYINQRKSSNECGVQQLQQSTSLHYLTKKSDVAIHRFSLDTFPVTQQIKQKSLKSYLTTINSSNSVQQKGNSSYFPAKVDCSQGRSQTVDGQSILTDDNDKRSSKADKVYRDIVTKTKRITEKLQNIQYASIQTSKSRAVPNLASLLKQPPKFREDQLRKVLIKTRTLLDQYKRENNMLQLDNLSLKKQLLECQQKLRKL